MAAKNPCARTVKPEEAYEVWQSFDGRWTYFVLKKYQSPEKEEQNLFNGNIKHLLDSIS